MQSSWQTKALIVGTALLVVTPSVPAAEPPAPNAITQPMVDRRDRFGDPLPNGAILSLGTTRLRQKQGVEGVTFSPDGEYLVSTGWGDSIRFWDVKTGRQVRRLKVPSGEGTFAAIFSPNGEMLASVGERGSVRLWDLSTGKVRFEAVGHKERSYGARVYGVSFAPDGLTFATAGADKSVRVWDVASGEQLLELQDDGGGDAHPVAFSPNGEFLASGSGSRKATIRLWNLNSGGEPKVIENAHERDITSLAFTPDGRHLISCGIAFERTGERSLRTVSQIHVWDVASGARVGQFESDADLAGDCSLALSVDGKTLCSSHHDKIVIWDVESRRALRVINPDSVQHGGRTHGLAISPDSKLVASKAFDHTVHVWNAETGESVLSQKDAHTNAVISVQFSPDGAQIITGSADATARLWDASTGDHRRIAGKSSGWIRYVEFFPDGRQVVLGSETRVSGAPGFQGEVKVCSVTDSEVIHHFPTDDRVMCGDLSQDSECIAVGTGLGKMGAFGTHESAEVRIHVWDLKSGKKLNAWPAGENVIKQIAFATDDNQVWSVSEEAALRQWDVRSGDELHSVNLVPEPKDGRFQQFVLAPDMTFVIAGGLRQIDRDSSLGVLELRLTRGGEQRWNKTLSDRWPSLLTTSSDGLVVAAYLRAVWRSKVDDRITLWSADDGHELGAIDIQDGSVRSMAFSPDGKRLATGMDRGHTLVWDVSAYSADRN